MAAPLPEATLTQILSIAAYEAAPRRAINDDTSHYETLRAASLVCRGWRSPAQSLLWTRVRLGADVAQAKNWLRVASLHRTEILIIWSPRLDDGEFPLPDPHPSAVPLAKKVLAACDGLKELGLNNYVELPKNVFAGRNLSSEPSAGCVREGELGS